MNTATTASTGMSTISTGMARSRMRIRIITRALRIRMLTFQTFIIATRIDSALRCIRKQSASNPFILVRAPGRSRPNPR